MKVAAFLLLAVGAMLGLGLALLPTSVSVLGTSGSCGPPLLRVFDTHAGADDEFGIEQGLIDQCVSQSWVRLVVGGVLASVAWVVALVMFLNASRTAPVHWGPTPPGWSPPPNRPW